jgi:tetratricopeptide (TPR) repeat protein
MPVGYHMPLFHLFTQRKMNPFTGLTSLFKRNPSGSTEANKRWLQGYKAFEDGKKYFAERRDQEAVDCFDTAVENGFEGATLFSLRASCLQSLEWDSDAIDDFTKAISLEPEDCNHYFQRAMSKNAIGDQQGFLADIQEAIRLSKVDNALNRNYNLGAVKMGWQSTAAMYKGQAALSAEEPDFIRDRKIERAKLRGRRQEKKQ